MLSMVNINDFDKYSRIIFGLGIVFFMLGILSSSFMQKVLGNNILVKGGEIAYCAYIVHWPIIETFSCGLLILLYGRVNSSYNFLVGVIFVLTFFLVTITALLLRKFVEPIGGFFANGIVHTVKCATDISNQYLRTSSDE